MIVNSESRIPRHVQAATELKRRIERGHYKTDSHLPSVRQLGAELGISHNAIQRAIQLLQRDGLVSSEHGIGVRVLALSTQRKLPLRFGMVHPYLPGSLFAGSLHSYIDQCINISEHHCIVKSSCQDPVREQQMIRGFIESGIEGLLVWPCGGQDNIEFLAQTAEHTPMVFVDRHFPDIPVPAVTLDWHGIGKDIVMHLASRGFRKCLILEDPSDISSYHELYAAMKQTAAETNTASRFDFAQAACSEFVEHYPENPQKLITAHDEHLSAMLATQSYDALFGPSDEYLDMVFANTSLDRQYPNLKLFSITNTLPTPRSLSFYRRNAKEWICNYADMFSIATRILHDKVHLKTRLHKQVHVDFSTVVRSA